MEEHHSAPAQPQCWTDEIPALVQHQRSGTPAAAAGTVRQDYIPKHKAKRTIYLLLSASVSWPWFLPFRSSEEAPQAHRNSYLQTR